MGDLTPFETLFALALNLERGEMHVLDGFRTEQTKHTHGPTGSLDIRWELLGEKIDIRCDWSAPAPTRPVEVAGRLRQIVIVRALDILRRHIETAIAAKEAKNVPT